MNARALMVVVIAGCSGSEVREVPDARPEIEIVPPAGVVAWFDCKNIGDRSGNNFFMLLGGLFANFITPDGYRGSGCYMDGELQYGLIDVGFNPANKLNFPGAFTVGMWIRPERTPTDFEVIASRSYGTGTDNSFALAIDSSLQLRYDSQGGESLVGSTSLTLDQWAFVALTFDGSTKRVFVNGALDGSGPAAAAVTWDHQYLIFGADEGPSATNVAHRLKGTLDDVLLFDRALDESELAALAAQ